MIAVVGGGLIGACVAFELSQSGEDVLVFDADLPGAAWRAGAGLLTPSGERLRGTPLEDDANESLGLWPAFARRLEQVSGQSVGFREGVYRVAFNDEEARFLNTDRDGEAVDLNANSCGAAPVSNDVPLEREGAPFSSADHAGVKASHLSAARFHAHEGRVHPPGVRSAALSGLRVVTARVERIEPLDAGVRLHLAGETIEARLAVLCCGAWSGAFGLPVRAVQGQALLLAASPDAPALYGPPKNGLSRYSLGRLDGLYVGATIRETGTDQTGADAEAHCSLREVARQLLGEDEAQSATLQQLVGFRPTTPDGLPLIGRHPTLNHVIVATGHSRHGVLLAPLTARRILELVRETAQDRAVQRVWKNPNARPRAQRAPFLTEPQKTP